jgi:hypothetical protein
VSLTARTVVACFDHGGQWQRVCRPSP